MEWEVTMPIDTSIYQNIKPLQINMPSPLEASEGAMRLSALGMQQREMADKLSRSRTMREAFSKNMGQDGKLNQEGFLSALGNAGLAEERFDYETKFAKRAKDESDARASQLEIANKTYHITGPAFDYLAGLPEPQRAGEWPRMLQTLKSQGVDVSNMSHPYDPGLFRQYLGNWRNSKPALENQLARAQIGKTQADTEKVRGDASNQGIERAAGLRKERSGLPTTKTTQEVSAAYNRIQEAARVPSAAGDLSLIFGFMKMLDPGSTVREGEFANAQNAGSAWQRAGSIYNRVLSGQRLTDEQRADFMSQAKGLWSAQQSQQMKVDKDFQRLAEKYGVNPDDVIVNFGADQPAAQEKTPPKTPPQAPSSEDMEAMHWLRKNPDSPDAAGVRSRLERKGLLNGL